MANFSDLGIHERLVKALDALELKNPTPIQQELLPVALKGGDVQASAETGSGKTASYILPILQRLMENPRPSSGTRALILVPTRELALQVDKHCRDLAAFTQINSVPVVGGVPYGEQKALIRKNPEVLVGTPGRVLEHVQQRSILLNDVECLVLDEADRMLDMGFREEVLMLVRACPAERQTFLLSATLVHEGLGRIAKDVLRDPEVVAIGSHRSKHANITQQRILADDPGHKQQLANWLLANAEYEKALVFTNMREHAEQLAGFLQSQRDGKGHNKVWDRADKKRTRVACLHGEMPQDERKKLMHWFREGTIKVLVSTDLAARGLDVKGVDLVVNFAMPRSGDDYVHRIGRTGRAGSQGLAISLVAPQEWNLMQSIERYLGIQLEPRSVEGLEARFQGPSKKGPTKKIDKDKKEKKKHEIPKAKQRHEFKKNIGKRRQPSNVVSDVAAPASPMDAMARSGMAPLKRRPESTAKPPAGMQWQTADESPKAERQRPAPQAPQVRKDRPVLSKPSTQHRDEGRGGNQHSKVARDAAKQAPKYDNKPGRDFAQDAPNQDRKKMTQDSAARASKFEGKAAKDATKQTPTYEKNKPARDADRPAAKFDKAARDAAKQTPSYEKNKPARDADKPAATFDNKVGNDSTKNTPSYDKPARDSDAPAVTFDNKAARDAAKQAPQRKPRDESVEGADQPLRAPKRDAAPAQAWPDQSPAREEVSEPRSAKQPTRAKLEKVKADEGLVKGDKKPAAPKTAAAKEAKLPKREKGVLAKEAKAPKKEKAAPVKAKKPAAKDKKADAKPVEENQMGLFGEE